MEMTNDRLTEAILITMITVFLYIVHKHEEELYYGLSEVVLLFLESCKYFSNIF